MNKRFLQLLLLALGAILLNACSLTPRRVASTLPPLIKTIPSTSSPQGGGYYKDDGPADASGIDLDAVPDAQPSAEPLHKWANRPYEVLGKKYVPLTQVKPFRQDGIASWYGKKFHGQKTSTGETYDMFAMTAAHPTLPLPSYARVTNPANGRSVVLRVNDRGPFHASRIMDLSYVAAHKLGTINSGSGRVIVEAIVPGESESLSPVYASAVPAVTVIPPRQSEELDALARLLTEEEPPSLTPTEAMPAAGLFLQLGAFASLENAENLKAHLSHELEWLTEAIHLYKTDQLYRLQLGPYPSRAAAEGMATRIQGTLGYVPTIVNR
ncbi:MAG: septal ring lytic transglycosylase RlpA family protein [Zoogloeaceae bacterium]|jgi:rare lipoprotein A|nr:septal ring lytic transglycosylase RlpA family protein [Zoogloeaceae bacterium]